MKSIITTIYCCMSIALSGQTYQLAISPSTIEWIGYGELGNFSQQGTILAKAGKLVYEDDALLSAEIVIDMTTITHDDNSLEKHLKNKDFFWVKKHSTAKMKMTSLENSLLSGELTIRGITHPIVCEVEISRSDKEVKIIGSASVDRTIYDIKYNSSSYFQDLGNYAIKNEFDLNFQMVFLRE